MNALSCSASLRHGAAAVLLALAGGCSALLPKPTLPPAHYSLDGAAAAPRATSTSPSTRPAAAPTLLVDPPRAAAGFDSRRIVYTREPHRLEAFAHSEWVDTPARMLAPLIVEAIESRGAFRATVPATTAAAGDLRLDTEIVRLQHEFGGVPSRVRFTLRATLVDLTTRRVLAWRQFDQSVASASEDPQGGVTAANRVVRSVLDELAAFCAQATLNR